MSNTKYIVIGIRKNPGKSDYVWVYKNTDRWAVTYTDKSAAQEKADSVNSDTSLAIYGATVVPVSV